MIINLKNHNLLLWKEIIILIHVEDFCKTSLIELFTKKSEYILGHEAGYYFSMYRKIIKISLDFFDISK